MREFLPAETEPYSTRHMKVKLKERFSNNLIIAEINGKADVATLRPTATKILQDFFHAPKDENSEDEKMRLVKTAAIILKNDIKSCMSNNDTYPSSEDISNTDLAYLPVSLRLLLEQWFVGKDNILKNVSIGQAIMQAVRPRVLLPPLQLGLGVQMHHHFASRFLIDSLHKHGFCCSYYEVQNYERSAAISTKFEIPGLFPGQFMQYAADNVDHNVGTLDGKKYLPRHGNYCYRHSQNQ